MGGVRARLTATLVALVVLTAAVLGIGAYAFVDLSLHDQFLRAAEAQARFDLTAVIPGRSPDEIQQIFRARSGELVIDRHDGGADGFTRALDGRLRTLGPGQLAYQWTTLGGSPVLVVGGQPADSGPT